MQLTHVLLLAGALGAVAHPSRHGHGHRSVHEKRDESAFYKNVRKPIPQPTHSTTQPAAAPSAPAAPAAAAPQASPSPGPSESTDFIPFCSGGASAKQKRVTEEQVMYTGNLGTSSGCPWNSNLMTVPNNIADKYDYVQKYTNVASEPYQVICANKMGADKALTGMFKVDSPAQKPLIFTLQPGETKTVVADTNTQGVCAFAPKEVPTTKDGQWAGVWAEFDVGSEPNSGWSGADCSSLVAQAYGMDVPGCRMSHGGTDSTILPGGKGDNAYTKGMEKLDGIGLNIPAGKIVIEVKVGFSG